MHRLPALFVVPVVEQVVRLRGVGLEVVELVLHRPVVPDVLVPTPPRAEHGRVLREAAPERFVVRVLASGGSLAGQRGEEGLPAHVARSRNVGDLQKRRCEVDVRDRPVDGRAGLDEPRCPREQRNPHRGFVGGLLADETVFAEREAVVGHVERQRRVGDAGRIELVHHRADALVEREQRLTVLPVEGVEPGWAAEPEVAAEDVVHPANAVALFAHPVRFVPVVRRGVGHRLRVLDRRVGVSALMTGRGAEPGVWGLVGEIEEERFVAAPVPEPPERVLRQDVGDVAVVLYPVAVDVELGVDVVALFLEAHPAVERRPGFGAVDPERVPLPDEGGLVAGVLEVVDEERVVVGPGMLVVDDAVFVGVLTGEDGGPARRTQRRADRRVREVCAPVRHPVHVRRLQELGRSRFVHEIHEIVPVVVAQNEDDVAGLGGIGATEKRSVGRTAAEQPTDPESTGRLHGLSPVKVTGSLGGPVGHWTPSPRRTESRFYRVIEGECSVPSRTTPSWSVKRSAGTMITSPITETAPSNNSPA